MSTVADVRSVTVTDQSSASAGGVDDVTSITVTDQTGGVWMVDTATVIGKQVMAAAYVPGPTGPQGPPGARGPAGPQGDQGEPGVSDIPGPPGQVGATGPAGVKGDRGDVGPTGPLGLTGPVGSTGPQGVPGVSNIPGPAGSTGPTGPQGLVGPTGGQGISGSPGLTGPTGPRGLQGIVGPTGTAGSDGAPGVAGATGPTGPAGQAGQSITGPTGPRGLAGTPGAVGATGPQGDVGPTGPPGTGTGGSEVEVTSTAPPVTAGLPELWVDLSTPNPDLTGPTGPTGPAGAASTVPGPAGATGSTGPAGASVTGPTGAPGPAGASVTGPTGPAGSVGPTGPSGSVGPTGPAGIQGVPGTVGATGPAGAPGAAGADSTVPGPAGATGPTGPAGASVTGPTGPTGGVGPTGPQGQVGPTGPAGSGGSGTTAVGAGMSYTSGTLQTSLSNERVVDFDTAQADPGFTVDLTANTLTVPTDGWYDLSAHVRLGAAVNTSMVLVVRNHVTSGDILRSDQLTVSQVELFLSGTAYLTAGTAIRLGFYSATATQVAGDSLGSFTFLHAVLLGVGPTGPTGPQGVRGSTAPLTVSATAPSSPNVGDVWVQAASGIMLGYAASTGTVSSINNPANVIGAPNGTFATATSSSHALPTPVGAGFAALSTLTRLYHVYIGVRAQVSSTACTFSLETNVGSDQSAKVMPQLAAANVSQDMEVELTVGALSVANVKASSVTIRGVSGTGTWSYDSTWMRVDYGDPITTGATGNTKWWDGVRWV